ncbi:MAG: uracil-DNA glycosylase family protein [Polaromonas sp.]|nr:uracil-DNA glycosylase family protein [Polaromonas sp.]
MSLQLDKRQRAMLREMGVRVWQPMGAPPVPATADAAIDTPPLAPAGFAMPGGQAVAAAPLQTAAPQAPAHVTPTPTPARVEPRPVTRPVPAPTVAAPAGLQARPAGVERMDWTALQTAVAGCRACSLCESRRNTVFGVGPAAADGAAPAVDWLIVGEAPGESEDRAGEPFVGQAGQLLDSMLQAIRLQRGTAHPGKPDLSSKVFVANVLKCRPPANRNPEPAEIAQCEPYLQRQVELLKPKVIVAMGKFAAQSLLAASVTDVQKTPLGKLRGQVHRYEGVPVIVTYHPAYLLRSLPDKAKAWDDLCLAMDVFAQPA